MNNTHFLSPGFDNPDADEHFADATLRQENDARERKLWGALLADKRFLQTRGYVVYWKDRKRGLICCDRKIISRSQLVKLADRTRQQLTDSQSVV